MDDGLTDEGRLLLGRSKDANSVVPYQDLQAYEAGIPDVVRLVSLWSRSREAGMYRCVQFIVPVGDIWKFLEAVLHKTDERGQVGWRCLLWITAGRIVGERAPFWAIPSELISRNEVALIGAWEHVPPIIWRKPGFFVPPPDVRRIDPTSHLINLDPATH